MFSWSRPTSIPPSSSSPPPSRRSSSGIGRDVHLASYLNHPVLKPSTRKVSNDDTIYDTVFQTTNNFALIIRVYLPTTSAPPSFTLHGVRATHSWLDIRMKVIGYSPIHTDSSWKASNMKLGDAVYAVIHHFQLNPPRVEEITDGGLRRLQDSLGGRRGPAGVTASATTVTASAVTASATAFQSQQAQPAPPSYHQSMPQRENNRPIHSNGTIQQQQTQQQILEENLNSLIPPIPSSFPSLETMTMSQIKQLLNDESTLDEFIKQTSEVVMLNEIQSSIESSNVDVAQGNLVNKEKVDRQFDELNGLRQELQNKLHKYNQLNEKRTTLTSPPDPSSTLAELNRAKKQAYKESEEIAENWIENGGDVNEFVKRFMEVRMLYHGRAGKIERLEMSM